jgi:hypothetical protein
MVATRIPGAIYAEQDKARGMTVFLWGSVGTWKTTWACQWPGVFFISIASEGGDDALRTYPAIAKMLCEKSQMPSCPPVFNMEQPPRVNITNSSEVPPLIQQICQKHKEWGIFTVVIDSLTHLIDLWLSDLIDLRERANSGHSNRAKISGSELVNQQDWGFLNNYLRAIRVHLNNAGLNVIWTCLQNDIYRPDPSNKGQMFLEKSIPMIQGATKVKLPSACKLHINSVGTKMPNPNKNGRMLMQPTFYTAPDMNSDLRHKYGLLFPHGCLMDPEFGTLPTFRALWSELHEYIYVGK